MISMVSIDKRMGHVKKKQGVLLCTLHKYELFTKQFSIPLPPYKGVNTSFVYFVTKLCEVIYVQIVSNQG